MEPRSYLQIPAAEIKSHDVAVAPARDGTVQRTLKVFIRGELSPIVAGIGMHASKYLREWFNPAYEEDREILESKINSHLKIKDALKEIRNQKGGYLIRRFPVPGQDKDDLTRILGLAFQTEEAFRAIDDLNNFIYSVNQLENPYDILIVCSSYLRSLTPNGNKEP